MNRKPVKVTFSLDDNDGNMVSFAGEFDFEFLADGKVRATLYNDEKGIGWEGFGGTSITAVMDCILHRLGEVDRPLIKRT